ncbi:sodium:proton antiporter [Thioalkalivibrio denitrificans]|uniref:Sodium:proton antiporter n=1 Tax=Thioalkalivibrio denitrificans TaxID=108003 RepID=A0A1V3NHZ5_9GAMM|nr:MnhB domain-containing protein [Thioalkalivibrio denitrificans]OOG24729.1 sodium:proton antiporter [Thioalkalivibrio denitrificans]
MRVTQAVSGALAAMLAALLAVVLWSLPETQGLRDPVAAAMDQAGVAHPVTAVLLNFRAYDTFLELGVLLLAVLGAWSLGRHTPLPARPVPGPVMPGTLRLLVPVAVVTGVYLLWAGSHAPGGAFQAGAVLGAAGVLWVLSRPRDLPAPPSPLLRLGLVAGTALFLAVGIAGLVVGHGFMGYPPPWAGALILIIETAATISIALTLVALFLGGAPAEREG